MKKSISLLFIIALVQMLSNSSFAQSTTNVATVKEFNRALSAEKNPQVLDVRTPEEFSTGHISGAKNINWNGSEFMKTASKLDKTKTLYIYCQAGGRSSAANKALTKEGFKIIELSGGMNAWNASKMKVEK